MKRKYLKLFLLFLFFPALTAFASDPIATSYSFTIVNTPNLYDRGYKYTAQIQSLFSKDLTCNNGIIYHSNQGESFQKFPFEKGQLLTCNVTSWNLFGQNHPGHLAITFTSETFIESGLHCNIYITYLINNSFNAGLGETIYPPSGVMEKEMCTS